jgi:uncharacterized lipoprotein NlpE involved in copper resistance
MKDKLSAIRTNYILALLAAMIIVTLMGCEDESDMAVNKVASPVLLMVEDTSADEIIAFVYELDKSGILDHTIGIDSIPVANLSIEVFASTASIGVFTTDSNGSFRVTYIGAKPNEYAGIHKGIAFRIKK